MHKIETKVAGKTVTLNLSDSEVESALSVCEINSLDEVIVMKKHNGNAAFYSDDRHANAAQERHGFKYAFTLQKTQLEELAKNIKKTGADKAAERLEKITPFKEFWNAEKYDLVKMSQANFDKLLTSLEEKSKK